MTLGAFVHGVVLAVGLIVALGPQNVFVFQQGAVQPRFVRALPTVLAACLADTVLVLLAVLGVSVVVLQFAWLETLLFGAGFVFLLYIGWMFLSSPTFDADPNTEAYLGAREQVWFTASVSLLNPHAIVDTVGVIGTSALTYGEPDRWVFTVGCLIVSWGWFGGLAVAGWTVGASANAERWLRYLNTVSAVVVWGVALYMGRQFAGSLGLV